MALEYKYEVHFIMVETMAVMKRWPATHRYIYKHTGVEHACMVVLYRGCM